jgi:hypothetical protein
MSSYSDVLEIFLDLKRRYDDEQDTDEKKKIREEAKPYVEDFLREGFDSASLVELLGSEAILDHSDLASEETLFLARKKWVEDHFVGIVRNDFKKLQPGITPTFVAENCSERHLHDLVADGFIVESYVNEGGDAKVLFDRLVEIYGYDDYDAIANVIAYGLVSDFDEDKLRESFKDANLNGVNKDYYAQLLSVSGYWTYEDAGRLVAGKDY